MILSLVSCDVGITKDNMVITKVELVKGTDAASYPNFKYKYLIKGGDIEVWYYDNELFQIGDNLKMGIITEQKQ